MKWRSIFAGILAAIQLTIFIPASSMIQGAAADPVFYYGDLDKDNALTVFDLGLMKKAVSASPYERNRAKYVPTDDFLYTSADLNADGQIDDQDLQLLQAFLLHQITEFPAGITFTQSDVLNINREIRFYEKTASTDGIWTIFVYCCGSNLETDAGLATEDIREMLDSSANKNVRFVVETGGSSEWWDFGISADSIQRFEICGGEMYLVDEVENANMGDGLTLADFLSWGVKQYPSEKRGLVLWDHGGGSIDGICADCNAEDGDMLLLKELDAALYSAWLNMTERFEFIGMDACLMASTETAALMAAHARYMIASEELEPGSGWNYTVIGDYLEAHPEASGAELGKVVCDNYIAEVRKTGEDAAATMSVIDLSRIDAVLRTFHAYAGELDRLTDYPAYFSDFVRNVYSSDTDSFGSNMVDLGGLIQAGSAFAPQKTAAAAQALERAVIYQVHGSDHAGASGLSVYYPLEQSSSWEMNILKDIVISPAYFQLMDKLAYGSVYGNLDGYSNQASYYQNDWSPSGCYDFYNNDILYYNQKNLDIWDYLDEQTNEPDISYEIDSDDGQAMLVLPEEELESISNVSANVCVQLDEQTFLGLGDTADLYCNWDTGTFWSNFQGKWYTLPDGQVLPAYLYSMGDSSAILYAPVLVNENVTNLLFRHDLTDDSLVFLGEWAGDGDRITNLNAGDVIQPLYIEYWTLDEETNSYFLDEERWEYGEAYTFDGQNSSLVSFRDLWDSSFWYTFELHDLYGSSFRTNDVMFFLEQGQLTVYIPE